MSDWLSRATDRVRSMWSNDHNSDPPQTGGVQQGGNAEQPLGGRPRSTGEAIRHGLGRLLTPGGFEASEENGRRHYGLNGGAINLGGTRIDLPSAELDIGGGSVRAGSRLGRVTNGDTQVEVLGSELEAGEVGSDRHGIRGRANLASVNSGNAAHGEVGEGIGTLGGEVSTGRGGIVVGGTANIGEINGAHGMTPDPELVDHGVRVGASGGVGAQIRITREDADGDGDQEGRIGVDVGPLSLDVMSEDWPNIGRGHRVRADEARAERERQREERRERAEQRAEREREENPPPRVNPISAEAARREQDEVDRIRREISEQAREGNRRAGGDQDHTVRTRPIHDVPGGHRAPNGEWISDGARSRQRRRRR
jgi:hypothetical protein